MGRQKLQLQIMIPIKGVKPGLELVEERTILSFKERSRLRKKEQKFNLLRFFFG